MSGHEARINDALKQLGEEFRLGMVQLAEYRARRRQLLESWGERDATTSPGALRSKTATMPNRATPPTTRAPAARRSAAPLIILVGVIVAAAAGYALLKPRTPAGPAPATAAPAPPPESPQVAAVRKAADDFLAANAWEPAAIDTFLQHWRALSPADRAAAADLPSLRTLRHKIDQNIQAESNLVAPDAPPEERQRLALLEAFARELAGDGP